MSISNITGPPVEGENFFGRNKELELAWEYIRNGNSLILAAPRRVGKSSFAKKLITFADDEDWNTLEINLEQIKSEESFVKLFVEKLKKESWWAATQSNAKDRISRILDSVKPRIEYEGVTASLEWKSKKSDIYEELKQLLDHEKPTLIVIDELTVLLSSFIENDPENGKRSVEFFLNWLRSFRQETGTEIRWVFCSSIGIDNFTSMYQLSDTLNDVYSFKLRAFPKETATELLQALANSCNLTFTPELQTYFLNKIAWYLPYFIQILFARVYDIYRLEDRVISVEVIDEAFKSLIDNNHLNTWEERLKEYVLLEKPARLLLKGLSKAPKGESRDVLLNRLNASIPDIEVAEDTLNSILYMLKNDGYLIVTEEDKYIFRSPLLRAFWLNRFAR